MKTRIQLAAITAAALAFIGVAFAADGNGDYRISSFMRSVLKARSPAELQESIGVVQVSNGGTGGATVAAMKSAFGFTSGTNVISDDGTVTNTFGITYSTIPVVVCNGYSPTATNATVALITTTNCIVAGLTNDIIRWIAIGQP